MSQSLERAMTAVNLAVDGITTRVDWPLHTRIGTALFWICTLDEALWDVTGYESQRDADPQGSSIPGLRRARNAVTHELTETHQAGGLEYPLFSGGGTLSYPDRWFALDKLGTGKKTGRLASEEAAYSAHVAGRKVIAPLSAARDWLRSCV